mgnify:FL=1
MVLSTLLSIGAPKSCASAARASALTCYAFTALKPGLASPYQHRRAPSDRRVKNAKVDKDVYPLQRNSLSRNLLIQKFILPDAVWLFLSMKRDEEAVLVWLRVFF